MDRILSSILYKDSPFLPNVSQESKITIHSEIETNLLPPIVALAKEVGLVGVNLEKIHEEDLDWIKTTFGSSKYDIHDFMFGFTTAPTLILAGYAATLFGFAHTIKLTCPPTKYDYMIRYNGYKSIQLPDAHDIINCTKHLKPLVGSLQIYDLCKKTPFLNEFYFLAGIEASQMYFTELANFIESS